jgi:hypothetical protein
VDENEHGGRTTDRGDGSDNDSLKVDPDERENAEVVTEAIEENAIGSRDEDQDDEFDSDEAGDPARVRISEDILDATEFSLLPDSKVDGEPEYRDEPEIWTVVFQHSEPAIS